MLTRVSLSATLTTLLLGSVIAQTPLLYDNGPLLTHTGAGGGGANVSALQNGPPLGLTVYGYGAQGGTVQNHCADDFCVCDAAWMIQEVEFFVYQTNSTTTSTINGVFLDIYDGPPNQPTSNIVAGSPGIANNIMLTGTVISNAWSGMYRPLESGLTVTSRPIMAVRVALPAPLTLTQGIYWVRATFTGTLTSGPWWPPITVLNQGTTGNAMQYITSTSVWNNPIVSGAATAPYAQGLPFRFYGQGATSPGAPVVYPDGCGNLGISVRGAVVPGGFFRVELTGVGAGLAFIGLDFIRTGLPLCASCTLGHGWSASSFGAAKTYTLPMAAWLCGLPLQVQGAEALGLGGCVAPPVVLSNSVGLVIR